jgi:hypothetical protein
MLVYLSFIHHRSPRIVPNIKDVATKVHVILRRFVVLTWMHGNRDLVECVTLGESHKVKMTMMTR